MLKGYIGTGIFALGAAFLNGGLLFGTLLLVAVTLLCLHCQHILVKACVKVSEKEVVEVLPSYAETVEYTFEDSPSQGIRNFSKVAGTITTLFLIFTEYGADIVYLIFISSHIKEIVDVHGWEVNYRVWLAIFLIPIWLPVFLPNLKLIAPFSILANILVYAGVVLIIYYSSIDLPSIKDRDLVADVRNWPKFTGIAIFSFEGITFILNVRMEMKHRENFTKPLGVLNVSIIIVVLIYVILGFMAYWKFGKCVRGSIFLNLPQKEVLAQVAKGGIALSVVVSYILHMYVPFEIAYPVFNRKYGPFKRPFLIMNVYKSFWVLVTYVFANIDSRLDAFIGFFGAITGSVVTLVLPAFIDIAMEHDKMKPWIIAKDIIIIVIAIFGAITGAVLSVIDIVNHIRNSTTVLPENCK